MIERLTNAQSLLCCASNMRAWVVLSACNSDNWLRKFKISQVATLIISDEEISTRNVFNIARGSNGRYSILSYLSAHKMRNFFPHIIIGTTNKFRPRAKQPTLVKAS